jgi:hypothetical protein
MDISNNRRILLVAYAFLFMAVPAVPQASQPSSATVEETIDWLVPTFNQTADETRSFNCSDGDRREQKQTSRIVRYAKDGTTLDILQESSGMYGDSSNTYHLTLGKLFTNAVVQRHNLVGGGSCHWVPNAWFQIVIIASQQGGIVSNEKSENKQNITILFDDETMANRCAAAISHLITRAGGFTPKPPPF